MTDVGDPWDELVAPSTRTPRAVETRDTAQRPTTWSPGAILPEIPPQDGWAFRWVRTASRGLKDDINFEKRTIEGWEPVNVSEFPEIGAKLKIKSSEGHIERGGLILCKMPQELVDQRNAYYQNRTVAEMEGAEQNYMRDSDERMRKVSENRRKVVFGR